MATFKPLLPISPSLKHSIPSPSPWVSFKPTSDSLVSFSMSQQLNRLSRLVAVSVAFNPSGNFDLSLYDDEDGMTTRISP